MGLHAFHGLCNQNFRKLNMKCDPSIKKKTKTKPEVINHIFSNYVVLMVSATNFKISNKF